MAALTALAAIAAPYTAAIGLVSTAITTAGVLQQANSSQAAAEYNAKVAERDAMVADQNRKATIDQAYVDAADKTRENNRVLSTMRASYGASGLDLMGSPLDVLTDTAMEQGLDVRRIEYEGEIRGRESALQMMGYQESAALSSAEASSISSGKALAALGTVSSGVGSTLTRVA